MLKKKISLALLIVIGSFLLLIPSAYASDAGAFLRIGAGARALGMGATRRYPACAAGSDCTASVRSRRRANSKYTVGTT